MRQENPQKKAQLSPWLKQGACAARRFGHIPPNGRGDGVAGGGSTAGGGVVVLRLRLPAEAIVTADAVVVGGGGGGGGGGSTNIEAFRGFEDGSVIGIIAAGPVSAGERRPAPTGCGPTRNKDIAGNCVCGGCGLALLARGGGLT